MKLSHLGHVVQGCHKPKQLNDGELKRLIFNHTRVADDCFLFVVDTARGKILYVSESVNQVRSAKKQKDFQVKEKCFSQVKIKKNTLILFLVLDREKGT